ncbi:MAG TPA: tRNA uridine-5-carboxymethylaminomethyl(34) synthesis GTPase MnmE, partial [Bacillales bacterium]|nr:tRNA uridine-5-carboxymethylaminomethyl(34) synthesis GTPase MnmE [Bacillales bacterium]
EAVHGMDVIVVVNKTDLEERISLERVRELSGGKMPIITTSLLEDEGVDELEGAVADLFFAGEVEAQDATYVSNSRHVALLGQAKKTIDEAISAIDAGMPVDMAQIDITRTWEILGEIVGDSVSDSLIDQLFSQFCLGK